MLGVAAAAFLLGGCGDGGATDKADQAAGQQPMLMVGGEAAQNLGFVFSGEMKTAKVPVANHGEAPLEFGSISSSCTRTSAFMTKPVLAPGEEGDLVYVYRAGPRPGPDMLRVVVATNDPEVPNLVVEVRAAVVAGFVTEPARVDVTMQPGEERGVDLRWRSDRWTIEPLSPIFKQPGVTGTADLKPISSGVQLTAKLAVPRDARPGLIETWVGLTMRLADPRDPEATPEERTVTIPVVITVPPGEDPAGDAAEGSPAVPAN